MKFIDKRRFHDREHSINVRFLKDCYTQDITNPLPSPDNPKRSFDDFKKDVYRGGKRGIDGWLDLLLEEQECRCCYCMKKLDSLNLSKINIEHVIPRSLNGDNGRSEYNYYTSKSEILHDYVMMSDEFAQKVFTNTDDIDREEKMPHITALANLLAACNGKQNFIHTKMCCCNNHRGDKRILPLMLMSQDDNAVIYDKNGLIIINEDDGTLKDTIIRDLNDKTLQDIRSVWYNLSRTDVDLEQAHNYNLKERIIWFGNSYGTNFASLPQEVKKFAGINKEQMFYWTLLMDYDWFYGYYKNH